MTEKWLMAVEPRTVWRSDDERVFRDWARIAAGSALEAEMEWLAGEPHRSFTGCEAAPPFCAFLSLRAQAGFDPDGLGAPARTKVVALRLREEPIFDRIRCEPGRVTPGVKKTTLWSARAGLDARDWEARYREHAKLVPSAHATAWRYRQNVIEAAPDGVPYDAVSELWWPSDEGLLEDFYASEQARCLVAEDTRGFIDVASAVQIVSRHERLC